MIRRISITQKCWLLIFSTLMLLTLVRQSNAQATGTSQSPAHVKGAKPGGVQPGGGPSGPKSGGVQPSGGPSGPKSGGVQPGGSDSNNSADAELNAYRQVREESLAKMEKKLKDRYSDFQTAAERVTKKLAGTP